ncbi:MAG TPA: UDP-2,3-diacylglucosamine diphosphatase [Candidatus Polarisedimenticolaceae bacterium]|nr:UDP-2,3-diacylglucosamine diphosphatase [Candidatus Polarisedimenticolaceae bacterium]
MSASRTLAFVGDVHLEAGDPALPEFLALLERLRSSAARLVLMGDLFDLWIGRAELEGPHHRAVAAKLAELRAAGVVVRYLEGNRDYRVAARHAGAAFDDAGSQGISEAWGGRRLFAVHGDLVNRADRQYRTWRRVSRAAPVWGAFHRLPARWRLALVRRLERRLRSTNLGFKRRFPEDAVRAFAAGPLAHGYDAVVLGHFHVERELVAGAGRIFVLPEWKGSRRHLEVGADGTLAFVNAAGGTSRTR